MAMLRTWDENPDRRDAIDEHVRLHLRGLREDDVPPLVRWMGVPNDHSHCCERLRDAVEFRCDQHPEPGECIDHLIGYSEKFDEYGLWIHDGPGGSASSWIVIQHCPFCGSRMRRSRRDEWFDRLDELGVEPEDAPAEMQGSEWWLGEGETARRARWMPEKKTWDWVCLTVLPRVGMDGQVRFGLAVAWIEGFNWGQDESISELMQARCEERIGRRTPLPWHEYVKADAWRQCQRQLE